MPQISIQDIRQKYPQYEDMSDQQLADGLYKKFYSDLPREEFNSRIGLGQTGNIPEGPTGAPGQAEAQPGRLPLGQGPSPATGEPGGPPLVDPEGVKARSEFFPIALMNRGDYDLAWPGFLKGPAETTEKVMKGELDPRSPEGIEAALPMAALGMPINPAVRAGAKAIPGVVSRTPRAQKAKVPTSQELQEAGVKGIESFTKESGAVYTPKMVQDWAAKAQDKLVRGDLGAGKAKKTHSILKDLAKQPKLKPGDEAITTASDLHAIRESLQAVKGSKQDRLAASRAVRELDKLIKSPPEESILAGAPTAARDFPAGIKNYAAAQRSKQLQELGEEAASNVKEKGSIGQLDSTIRGGAKRLSKKREGFSKAERAQLKGIREGVPGANLARGVGKLTSGAGTGMLGQMAAGGTAGGFALGAPGAVMGAVGLPAAHYGAKRLAGTLSRRGLRKLDKETRKRSPLYEERLANPPMDAGPGMGAEATIRAMLLSGMIAAPGLPAIDQAQAGEVTPGLPYADQQLPTPQQQPAPQQPTAQPAQPQEQQVATIDVPQPKPLAKTFEGVAAAYGAHPQSREQLRLMVVKSILKGAFLRGGEDRDAYIRDAFSPESMQYLALIFGGPENAETIKEQILIRTMNMNPVN